jgi:hypothetical protein
MLVSNDGWCNEQDEESVTASSDDFAMRVPQCSIALASIDLWMDRRNAADPPQRALCFGT